MAGANERQGCLLEAPGLLIEKQATGNGRQNSGRSLTALTKKRLISVMKFLFMLLVLLNLSCGYKDTHQVSAVEGVNGVDAKSPSPTSTLATSGASSNSIRAISFRDFTYLWYPEWDSMLSKRKEFTLRNGKVEVEIPKHSNEPYAFELANVSYGDVTGDGVEEALVTIKMRVMGNAKPYAVFVYTLTNSLPRMLWVHETGDRADEGLRNVYVSTDGLVIEQYNADKLISDDGEETKVALCCPKTFTRTYYAWRENRFQKSSEETLPNEHQDARVLVGS